MKIQAYHTPLPNTGIVCTVGKTERTCNICLKEHIRATNQIFAIETC